MVWIIIRMRPVMRKTNLTMNNEAHNEVLRFPLLVISSTNQRALPMAILAQHSVKVRSKFLTMPTIAKVEKNTTIVQLYVILNLFLRIYTFHLLNVQDIYLYEAFEAYLKILHFT